MRQIGKYELECYLKTRRKEKNTSYYTHFIRFDSEVLKCNTPVCGLAFYVYQPDMNIKLSKKILNEKKNWVKKDETNQKQCKAEITYFTDFNIMSNHTHTYIHTTLDQKSHSGILALSTRSL